MERFVFGVLVLALIGLIGVVVYYVGLEQRTEERFTSERGSFKTQIETAERGRRQLEGEVSSLKSENNGLKGQLAAESSVVTGLKEEIERLKVGGVAAVRAVAETAAAEAAARRAAVPEAPTVPSADELRTVDRQEREKRIAEITKKISDLELRKTNLRAQIGAGQNEVAALSKASVDVRMIPPPGGYISDGQIYRRDRYNVGTTQYPDWRERSYAIGPAVKIGDFRTEHDKGMAMEAARTKLLPLFEEVRALDNELDPLKKELAKLGKEKTSGAKTPEEAPGTVLKHKETGETIKGTLTRQKINNLTVFKLANGGTKTINPDEWETIEADAATAPPAAR